MNDMKKNMRRVFWLFFLLFLLTAAYLIKLVLFDSSSIIANSYNKRIDVTDNNIKRGFIFDRNGEIIVQSDKTENGYTRNYLYGNIFSHVLGYSGHSKAGLELSYNFEMQKLNFELVQRVQNAISGEELVGNSINTTLDLGLQQLINKKLGGEKASVVVTDPSTGKILAMVSAPNFNPNTISENWKELSGDSDNSPLLNRAAQGLYPPGSTFKIITAAAALEKDPELIHFTYTCTGQETFGDSVLHCSGSKAHGKCDLKKAMEVSCNTYFATLSQEIGAEAMAKMAENFYFNKPYGVALEYRQGSFNLPAEPTLSELIETSIGQGKTLASPLNMVLMAGAVGNGGVMMKPYVVESIVSKNGSKLKTFVPQSLGQPIPASTAAILNEMLIDVVKSGTGKKAGIDAVTVAGKTGTAQNSTGIDHSWFVGYAPADNPTVAVSIIIENTSGGSKATTLAHDIFNYCFN